MKYSEALILKAIVSEFYTSSIKYDYKIKTFCLIVSQKDDFRFEYKFLDVNEMLNLLVEREHITVEDAVLVRLQI